MKTSAVIRIVVWSLLAVILLGILITGLRGKWDWNWLPFHIGYNISYPDSELYKIGGSSVKSSEIDEIEIHWVSGKVKVTAVGGDQISFEENDSEGLPEEERMRYYVNGKKLIIRYSAPTKWFQFFRGSRSKTLKVELPGKLLDSVEINCTSADVEAEEFQAKRIALESVSGRLESKNLRGTDLSFKTVSGRISSVNLTADRTTLESVSGGVDIQGEIRKTINGENVLGNFRIDSGACPEQVNLSTVSGNIELSIPENDGFTARYDTVSGRFNCDFAAKSSKDMAVYKNGGADIHLETVSGGIDLLQN